MITKVLDRMRAMTPSRRKRPPIARHHRYTRDVLKGADMEIGEYTYGVPRLMFRRPGGPIKLKIGRFCSIASGVTILLGGNHRKDYVTTYPFRGFTDDWPEASEVKKDAIDRSSKGDVVIGNDVWIGHGATILSGVHIGDGAVIGAEAVIARNVEPYTVVAGNPARPVGKRFDDETIEKLLALRWWERPKSWIAENMSLILSADTSGLIEALERAPEGAVDNKSTGENEAPGTGRQRHGFAP